jgi:hypothetical protein
MNLLATARRTTARARTVALVLLAFLLTAGTTAGLTLTGSAQAAVTKSHTRLDVTWGDTTPVAGVKVLVYGFAFPGQSGRLLRVETPTGASGTWRTVGSVRTLSNGSFTVYLQHTVAGAHSYRVSAPATTTATAALSRSTTFHVYRRTTTVTAALSATAVPRRTATTLHGTVGPDFTARKVTVQGRIAGAPAWSTVGTLALDASREWSLAVPTGTAGAWEYRATVGVTPYARAATSPVVALRVAP